MDSELEGKFFHERIMLELETTKHRLMSCVEVHGSQSVMKKKGYVDEVKRLRLRVYRLEREIKEKLRETK